MSCSTYYLKKSFNLNWPLISIYVAYSAIIPFFAGIYKINQIQLKQRYFVYLLCIYFFTNIVGSIFLFLNEAKFNSILSNVFVLIDFVYLYILISNWLSKKVLVFEIIIVFFILLFWAYENLIFSKIDITNIYFRILYSFVISIKSIELINKTITVSRKKVWKNPYFIIASTFVLYYSYKAIYETVYLITLDKNPAFAINAFKGLLLVNLISYISYAIGILCMNKKVQMNISYY